MQCLGPKTRSLLQAYENVNRLLADSSSFHLHPWSPSDSYSLCLFFEPAFPELALSGRGVGVGCSWILLEKGRSLSHQRGWWESRDIRKWSLAEVTVLVSPVRAVESLQKKDARPGVWGKRLSRSLLSYAPGRLALYQREVGMCDWIYRAPWLGELPSHSCPGLGSLREGAEVFAAASVFWREVQCVWCSWNWQEVCQTEGQLRCLLVTWGDPSILFMARNCPWSRGEQWNCHHDRQAKEERLYLHQ